MEQRPNYDDLPRISTELISTEGLNADYLDKKLLAFWELIEHKANGSATIGEYCLAVDDALKDLGIDFPGLAEVSYRVRKSVLKLTDSRSADHIEAIEAVVGNQQALIHIRAIMAVEDHPQFTEIARVVALILESTPTGPVH